MNERVILEHLEKIIAFEAVARLGSFHRAGQELGISQPSLSVKIRRVEEILGVVLLERSSRGVRITEKGEKLLAFCRDVIRLSQDLQFDLLNSENSYKGFIRLGVYDSIARYLWPRFHVDFAKAYPLLKLQLSSGRSGSLITQIIEKKIDLAITVEPPTLSGLVSYELYSDRFSLFVQTKLARDLKFPKISTRKVRPSKTAFQDTSLISFSSAHVSSGRQLISELQASGLSSEDVMLVESFEISLEFCLKGLGIAVLPRRVAQESLSTGKILEVSAEHIGLREFSPHTIYLSTLQENANARKFELLRAELEKFVKGLPYVGKALNN